MIARLVRIRGRLVLSFATLALLAGAVASAKVDVPTGARPSPLWGVQPFSQQMLRFEEFGLAPLPEDECTTCTPMAHGECNAGASPSELDDYLAQPISPLPTRTSNYSLSNPWKHEIDECIRPMVWSPAEGRPPGEWFAHQRWDEFPPQRYFQTATTGARVNGGLRDSKQRHGYALGEFGPNGLYHNTVGTPGFEGTTRGISVRFHTDLPAQDPRAIWTFDGTFPPKLTMARYGVPILFRHYNALPIDPSANLGFGLHTLSTHEHNGHVPAESDGYTQSFFFPGQFFDYRWPMILAGHDHINTTALDPRAATPDGKGGDVRIRGDWRETMSTHWFHDHMIDFTAQNVYKGSAAMMNYYSAVDRGNEAHSCHYEDSDNVNLCLPSGTALDWGNRDYDLNLLIADKAWGRRGQLFFNIFNLDGFLGDRMTVNWLYKPYVKVRARRYRLRILNGSVSRYFKLAIVDEEGQRVPFHMVANDGNIMEHAVSFPNAESVDLPVQAVAERYDIVIDFSRFEPGERVYLVNLLPHKNGRGPEDESVPLAEVLSGDYADRAEGRGRFDPAVGKFLEFRVVAYAGTDRSMDPVDYEPGKKKMIPLPRFSQEELANARIRTFEFGRSNGTDSAPWTIKTEGGQGMGVDPHRLSAAPDENGVEIWRLENAGNWSHPVHIHFEEGQILSRDGVLPPIWERWARKDIYRIGREEGSSETVEVALRFREFLGSYVEHCHNTQHEDHAMMLRWDLENPGEFVVMPTPMPTWEGSYYEDTSVLPTYKTGDLDAARQGPPRLASASGCGNQIVEAGETCDDGNGVPGDGCDGLCQIEVAPAFCGDGHVDAGESCDDGNADPGDGCSAVCVLEPPAPACGDGNGDAGEECDDGNTSDGDGCSAACVVELPPPACGDGNVDEGEECDDGNVIDGDGCSAACVFEPLDPLCGDGHVDTGEECDDGNADPGDGCSAACGLEPPAPVCGDGHVDAGEECDDGNPLAGDGCSDLCMAELDPAVVVASTTVDDSGRVRLRGHVARGESVIADHAAVTCRTRRGIWRCSARGLAPGTVVNVLLEQP